VVVLSPPEGLPGAPPPLPSVVYCPQCSAEMAEQAVLCTNCGYDKRTGKSLAAATAPAPMPVETLPAGMRQPGKVVDYMAPAPDGSLVLGIVYSALFALFASLVWIAAVYLTGYSIGYIAILIGAAAGVGMQLGHKGYSNLGGMIAAGMTIFAILVAKFVVLEAILARDGKSLSLFNLNGPKLGYYFFNPIGSIIILIGVGAAYRTASGSRR
jgi:hypothetical protein